MKTKKQTKLLYIRLQGETQPRTVEVPDSYSLSSAIGHVMAHGGETAKRLDADNCDFGPGKYQLVKEISSDEDTFLYGASNNRAVMVGLKNKLTKRFPDWKFVIK